MLYYTRSFPASLFRIMLSPRSSYCSVDFYRMCLFLFERSCFLPRALFCLPYEFYDLCALLLYRVTLASVQFLLSLRSIFYFILPCYFLSLRVLVSFVLSQVVRPICFLLLLRFYCFPFHTPVFYIFPLSSFSHIFICKYQPSLHLFRCPLSYIYPRYFSFLYFPLPFVYSDVTIFFISSCVYFVSLFSPHAPFILMSLFSIFQLFTSPLPYFMLSARISCRHLRSP